MFFDIFQPYFKSTSAERQLSCEADLLGCGLFIVRGVEETAWATGFYSLLEENALPTSDEILMPKL